MSSFRFLIFIILSNLLLFFLIISVITDIIYYRKNKKCNFIHYIVTGIYILLALILIPWNFLQCARMDDAVIRHYAIVDLKRMVKSQNEFKAKHKRYAKSFKELGFTPNMLMSSYYAFCLNDDIIYKISSKYLPKYIKINNLHIYAIWGHPNRNGEYDPSLGIDILSIDYNGNIEVIDSVNIWPLLEP